MVGVDLPRKAMRPTIYDRAVAKAAPPSAAASPGSGPSAARPPASITHVASTAPSTASIINSVLSSPRETKSSASTPPSSQGSDPHRTPAAQPKRARNPPLTLAQYLGHETPPASLATDDSGTSYVTYKPTIEERVARLNSDGQREFQKRLWGRYPPFYRLEDFLPEQRASRSTIPSAPPSFTSQGTKRRSSELDDAADGLDLDSAEASTGSTEDRFALEERKGTVKPDATFQTEGYRDHQPAKRPRYETPTCAGGGAHITMIKSPPAISKDTMSCSKTFEVGYRKIRKPKAISDDRQAKSKGRASNDVNNTKSGAAVVAYKNSRKRNIDDVAGPALAGDSDVRHSKKTKVGNSDGGQTNDLRHTDPLLVGLLRGDVVDHGCFGMHYRTATAFDTDRVELSSWGEVKGDPFNKDPSGMGFVGTVMGLKMDADWLTEIGVSLRMFTGSKARISQPRRIGTHKRGVRLK
ncbi:hypothetical protein BU16DRAFT_543522 [Lophium mytilinum]|uniref:Uncharacterized protein n=1 Tax=Lophium mytilinum TaxID=390894 RepID=A0A6A6QDP7_9PEZI|nr:hypothetical protein BU16DRAFT_543522 [Lophium mytilinum]